LTIVIVSLATDMSGFPAAVRLGTFQRLILALFVTAPHQRVVRRIEIQPNFGSTPGRARDQRSGPVGI